MMEQTPGLRRLIALALEEDLGPGDITSEGVVPLDARAEGKVVAKQPLVVFGLNAMAEVFRAVDDTVWVEKLAQEAAPVPAGTVVATVKGPARPMLAAERTALNLLMRLSGVATLTRAMKTALKEFPNVKLLDTRKTTPGLRALEKAAVRAGGGTNHRMGLFDGVLIKDNHIAVAGGIAPAVARARQAAHHLVRVQCEVVDVAGVATALEAGVDALLLDNMGDGAMGEAVRLARQAGRPIFVEASGNMTVQRLPRVAALGVDGISVGALTHSATAVDLSLEFTPVLRPT